MNTNTNRNKRAIGTFPNRNAAEEALHELKDSDFPMNRVSVVAKDSEQNETIAGVDVSDHAENKADDGAKVGALSGGTLGGLTGLLVGLGVLAIPGVGPIMLAGAAATALATTVAGGAIGAAAGSLLGGLIGLGIPEEQAKVYNDRVSAGEYLVMVDGTDAEIAEAEAILNRRGIEEWGVYDVPATESATLNQSDTAAPSIDMAHRVTGSIVNDPEVNRRANANPSFEMGDRVTPVVTAPVVNDPEVNQCGTAASSVNMAHRVTPVVTGPVVNDPEVNQRANANPSFEMGDRVTPVVTGPVVNDPEANQRGTGGPSVDIAHRETPVVTGTVVNDPEVNEPISSTDAQTVKLYEERLILDKDRQKIGEVAIGKRVEVETSHLSVPIEKERLVIERVPISSQTVPTSNVDPFHNNETVRVAIYEDTPDIYKEAFVREEVSIRKEVTQETFNAEETLRREELYIDTQGRPVVDNRSDQPGNPHR